MQEVLLKMPSSKKDRNLIKGALRRVFSRSEIRRAVLENSNITWLDKDRPRVKKWSICPTCLNKTPTYLMQVDHIKPIIDVKESLDDLTWDELIDRIWSENNLDNLIAICKDCHKMKTKEENKQRRLNKKKHVPIK